MQEEERGESRKADADIKSAVDTMKVLIIAYACEPGKGGESEIAWALISRLAKSNRVWVLTRSNNRNVLEAESHEPNLQFLYYDLPGPLLALKGRGGKRFLAYYYLWNLASARAIRRFDREHDFDVIHHLTGGMDWMPSGAAFQKKPFIWGPVGSENTHRAIRAHMPWPERIKDYARSGLRSALRRYDPSVRHTRSRADLILSHTPKNFSPSVRGKVKPFVQTGIDASPRMAMQKTDLRRNGPMRVIYAGEFVGWKGALLAIKAFAKFHAKYPDSRLVMVGSGGLEPDVLKEIRRNEIGNVVTLKGRLPMDDLKLELHDSDVFLYPTYHHGLATILLQAMLTGLPTVCLEGDAIGRVVKQKAGLTLTPTAHGSLAEALSQALLDLASNEKMRQEKARNAREIARSEYCYGAMAHEYTDIYSLVASSYARS